MAKFRIGLTGGIGSGKSTVCKFLQSLQVPVISADDISYSLTAANGLAMPQIQKVFGLAAVNVDGSMNRSYMRELVFQQSEQRQVLQSILHPLIDQQVQYLTQESTGLYLVYDVPLLIESYDKWRARCNRICVVDCDEQTQIHRVMARSQLNREAILNIMATQVSRERRLSLADDVIDNTAQSTLESLQSQVQRFHQQWIVLSQE